MRPRRLPARGVDIVTARMVLHDVDDLDAVPARGVDSMDRDGRLVMSVVHPVVTSGTVVTVGPRTTAVVDRYLEPGPRVRPWLGSTVTWHHRTIEQDVAALQRAGLVLAASKRA